MDGWKMYVCVCIYVYVGCVGLDVTCMRNGGFVLFCFVSFFFEKDKILAWHGMAWMW